MNDLRCECHVDDLRYDCLNDGWASHLPIPSLSYKLVQFCSIVAQGESCSDGGYVTFARGRSAPSPRGPPRWAIQIQTRGFVGFGEGGKTFGRERDTPLDLSTLGLGQQYAGAKAPSAAYAPPVDARNVSELIERSVRCCLRFVQHMHLFYGRQQRGRER